MISMIPTFFATPGVWCRVWAHELSDFNHWSPFIIHGSIMFNAWILSFLASQIFFSQSMRSFCFDLVIFVACWVISLGFLAPLISSILGCSLCYSYILRSPEYIFDISLNHSRTFRLFVLIYLNQFFRFQFLNSSYSLFLIR